MSSSQSFWTWDPQSQQYYCYDENTDTYCFADGRSFQCPGRVPRTTFSSAGSRAAANSIFPRYISPQRGGRPGYVASPLQSNSRPPTSEVDRQSKLGQEPATEYLTRSIRHARLQPSGALVPESRALAPTQPQVISQDGKTLVRVQDPNSGVQTNFFSSPAEYITDPDLYRRGITASKRVVGTSGDADHESLFNTFRKRNQPRKFFTVGKVFMMLWVEPAGERNTLVTNFEPGTSLGRFGERVFSKVRRFVVIRETEQYCSALPITSYGHRGVGKKGVKKSDHSIVYTGKVAPKPLQAELPDRGEQPMRPQAIQVNVDDPTDKLDELARLDYGRVHTVQHDIKVRSFGKVNPKSMNALLRQFQVVWNPALPLYDATLERVDSTMASLKAFSVPSPGPDRRLGHRGPGSTDNSSDSDDDSDERKSARESAINTCSPLQDPAESATILAKPSSNEDHATNPLIGRPLQDSEIEPAGASQRLRGEDGLHASDDNSHISKGNLAGSIPPQILSHDRRSGSVEPHSSVSDRSQKQAQRRAEAEAMMARLLHQGYSFDQGRQMVSAHFSNRTARV